jgi:hypothetical protein
MSTTENAPPISDAELAGRLVGTWATNPDDAKTHASLSTYNSDGTGREVVSFPGSEGERDVELVINWTIQDGVLHLKSVSSSDPDRIPVGLELKDRVLAITDEKFEYTGDEGYRGFEGMRELKVRVR